MQSLRTPAQPRNAQWSIPQRQGLPLGLWSRTHARGSTRTCSNASGAAPVPDEPQPTPTPSPTPAPSASANPAAANAGGTVAAAAPKGILGRIKYFFLGDKLDKDKLAQLGMGAFASYGFISNVTYGICLGIAWISFVKATGQSPLWAGQWPAFLAFYAGLWTFQNFVRPLRFSLAIALAPVFERMILWISSKTGLEKKWAFGLYLFCFAITTCVVLFGSLYLLGGFPPAPAAA